MSTTVGIHLWCGAHYCAEHLFEGLCDGCGRIDAASEKLLDALRAEDCWFPEDQLTAVAHRIETKRTA